MNIRMAVLRIAAAALAMSLACATAAIAQGAANWPTRIVKVIIPFPAGTSPDVVVRLMSPRLTELWGHAVVVENRVGAGGTIGAAALANAAPDGYTWLYSINSLIVANPHLYAKLAYDPIKQFAPASLVVNLGYVLLARPGFPAGTLAEFIALAKSQPGKLNYGSSGPGTGPHVVMEMLNGVAGLDIVHIPMGTSMNAIMSGEVDVTLQPNTTAVPLARGGKVRALAVTLDKRLASLPDVPAIAETFPGFAADAWHGLFAPAGTPQAIIDKVSADWARVLKDPEIRKRLLDLGLEPIGSTPQQFSTIIRSDYDKWGAVIRRANIKLD